MSAENDGGPAFPHETYHGQPVPFGNGMSMRDWFATHATEADIEAHTYEVDAVATQGTRTHLVKRDCTREQARFAYADAMLEARATR